MGIRALSKNQGTLNSMRGSPTKSFQAPLPKYTGILRLEAPLIILRGEPHGTNHDLCYTSGGRLSNEEYDL